MRVIEPFVLYSLEFSDFGDGTALYPKNLGCAEFVCNYVNEVRFTIYDRRELLISRLVTISSFLSFFLLLILLLAIAIVYSLSPSWFTNGLNWLPVMKPRSELKWQTRLLPTLGKKCNKFCCSDLTAKKHSLQTAPACCKLGQLFLFIFFSSKILFPLFFL